MSDKMNARGVLPPRALVISLMAQLPLLYLSWPLAFDRTKVIAGAALLLTGVALNLWADRLFRRNNVGVCPFSRTPVLLAQGPYRWTRNPMYLGLVLVCASPALGTGLHANLAAAAVLLLWLHFRFILPEEAFLREQFGTAYLSYASSRPRWFGLPGPGEQPRSASVSAT